MSNGVFEKVRIWREGEWFVSQRLDVDVASQGQTEEEALENLREALELYLESPVATQPPAVDPESWERL